MSSRIEPDWISTITIVQPQDKHGNLNCVALNYGVFKNRVFLDVVIGVSVSGMIKLWSLTDLDKKVKVNLKRANIFRMLDM